MSAVVVRRLAHAYDFGMLVLEGAESWIDYVRRLPWDPADVTEDGTLRPLREWRRTVGPHSGY